MKNARVYLLKKCVALLGSPGLNTISQRFADVSETGMNFKLPSAPTPIGPSSGVCGAGETQGGEIMGSSTAEGDQASLKWLRYTGSSRYIFTMRSPSSLAKR